MALNYTTLFDRLGKGISMILGVNTFRYTTLPGKWTSFITAFDGENDPAVRACINGATDTLATAKAGLNSIQTSTASSISSTIIEMLNAESPLTSKTIANGMAELSRLMIVDGKTVDANAVGSTVTAGSNSGTGRMVTSQLNGRGKTIETIYDEIIDVTFTTTTQALASGEASADSLLADNWPLGSACSKAFTAISTGGASDLLSGGNMETFTVANIPDGWSILVGSAGTDILSEASVIYGGAKALKILGDGATLSSIGQVISGLAACTPYAVNFWAKMGVAPAAGILTVDLWDGAAVINDEAGTANSFTVDLTTLGTTYVPKGGVFRLPEPVPASVTLRLRLSTALTNTRALYLDNVSLGAMTQLYTGGPYASIFVGSTAFSLDDTFSVAMTNDYGGAVQTGLWRALNLATVGVTLPSNSSGGENILDSVIP